MARFGINILNAQTYCPWQKDTHENCPGCWIKGECCVYTQLYDEIVIPMNSGKQGCFRVEVCKQDKEAPWGYQVAGPFLGYVT